MLKLLLPAEDEETCQEHLSPPQIHAACPPARGREGVWTDPWNSPRGRLEWACTWWGLEFYITAAPSHTPAEAEEKDEKREELGRGVRQRRPNPNYRD